MSQDGHGNGDGIGAIPSAPTEGLPGGFMAPGQVLGERYEVREQLGRGGMGEVWRAFDLKLRVEVALKAMLPELFKNEKRRDMLRREVRAAREVVSPNVCRIFDLIEVEGRELVSMEYVDGATLLEMLAERGPLDLKEAQDIASQFLAGLEAIHQAGLVHRDVKPENIMITRAGRVVLMDFGLARQEDSGEGTVAGTPAYMAPEQAVGLKVDARADVYAAGVVLAEMVSPDGIRNFESRQSVWEGIREEPARVPNTPWAPVLKRAVAKEPDQRPNSAHTLIRELEDVTLRVEGAEDLTPYPGLASFTEEDAEYFFGREAEVEQMWRKLEGPPRLLAIVGPSGAGKTSFLRAGLVPSAPSGCSIVRCTPGSSPSTALGQAMVPALAGDTEATQALLRIEDPEAAVGAIAAWARKSGRGLLIVDQFEELFTLNPPEVQSRFAALLARLPLEANVHVMLCLRDDFLVRCRELEDLSPLFADITVLLAPSGAPLRRALTQPALQCGYRFEDEELVEEMLTEVEGERGALPLLAFAAARLWEQRDRESGLLTRQSYRGIEGVGGALAQHAEGAVERIGAERLPIMRELFRNLVTAEGTRGVREWNELLSIFDTAHLREGINPSPTTQKTNVGAGFTPARETAERVLRELIDARLLTSYEVRDEHGEPSRRVEIIHESLLANWPRLVRWQTQDADAAQLRDQLRQAARTWDERGRTSDLLWTGSAYREFTLWRERYPGGLTETEEAFASAMTAFATRQKRRRRVAVAAGFLMLIAILAVVTGFWRTSVRQTRRAEAQQLIAMARQDFENVGRSERALAFVVASLEIDDQRPARELAIQHARRAPLPLRAHSGVALSLDFSPDGRWLAAGDPLTGTMMLWSSEGGEPHTWQAYEVSSGRPVYFAVGFTPDSLAVMTYVPINPEVRLWSVPDGRPLGSIDKGIEGVRSAPAYISAANMVRIVRGDDGSWALDRRGANRLQQIDPGYGLPADFSDDGEILAYAVETDLYLERFESTTEPEPELIWAHEKPLQLVELGPEGRRIATQDVDGNVYLVSMDSGDAWHPQQRYGFELADHLVFNRDGSVLAAVSSPHIFVSDLLGPPDAQAVSFDVPGPTQAVFHPSGRWIAAAGGRGVSMWPVERDRLTMVLHGHATTAAHCEFGPDGRWLVSTSIDRTVRWWPLEPSAGDASKVLFEAPGSGQVYPYAAVGSEQIALAWGGDSVKVVPLGGGPAIDLDGSGERLDLVAIDPESRYVAAVGQGASAIHVWELESGRLFSLDVGDGLGVENMRALPGGRLLVRHVVDEGANPGLTLWEVEASRYERIFVDDQVRWTVDSGMNTAVSDDGRLLLGFRNEAVSPREHRLLLGDLSDLSIRRLDSFLGVFVDLDTDGSTAVTLQLSPRRAFLQVGKIVGQNPHLVPLPAGVDLYGLPSLSPDGRRVAMGYGDGSIRLHPVPDLDRPSYHALPHDELIARLKTLTNLRVVRDSESDTGWELEFGPFPGWETVPEW